MLANSPRYLSFSFSLMQCVLIKSFPGVNGNESACVRPYSIHPFWIRKLYAYLIKLSKPITSSPILKKHYINLCETGKFGIWEVLRRIRHAHSSRALSNLVRDLNTRAHSLRVWIFYVFTPAVMRQCNLTPQNALSIFTNERKRANRGWE